MIFQGFRKTWRKVLTLIWIITKIIDSKEGITGFYMGVMPTIYANVAEKSVLFFTYGPIQRWVSQIRGHERSTILDNSIAGQSPINVWPMVLILVLIHRFFRWIFFNPGHVPSWSSQMSIAGPLREETQTTNVFILTNKRENSLKCVNPFHRSVSEMYTKIWKEEGIRGNTSKTKTKAKEWVKVSLIFISKSVLIFCFSQSIELFKTWLRRGLPMGNVSALRCGEVSQYFTNLYKNT